MAVTGTASRGPNLDLKPEFAKSYEFGTELSFLDDRLGIDATVYRKRTQDQIVNDIRGSYATGFILFNLNGAETKKHGCRAYPSRIADTEGRVLVGCAGKLHALERCRPQAPACAA